MYILQLVFFLYFAVFFAGSNSFAGNLKDCKYDTAHGYADLAEKIFPSVVNVFAVQMIESSASPLEEFFGYNFIIPELDNNPYRGKKTTKRAATRGSGFFIDEQHIVTNYHVIREAKNVKIVTHDKKEYKASVVGFDEKSDLVVLKVSDIKNVIPAKFGSSTEARVGDVVLAVGNPFNLGLSMTQGIISAKSRGFTGSSGDNFIQTDAAMNHGNSGGPLFDLCGNVIGINTAIVSNNRGNVGVGFAITSDSAAPIIEKLKNKQKITRSWMGVGIQPLTEEISDALDLPDSQQGSYINEVSKNSPAEKAGLKPGDVIIAVDGKEMEIKSMISYIEFKNPGETLQVSIIREGKKKIIPVTTEERKGGVQAGENAKKVPSNDTFNIEVENLTQEKRLKMAIPANVEGVVITAINNKALITFGGVMEGDILMFVNNNKISSPEELKKIAKQVQSCKKKHVIFKLYNKRDGGYVSIGVPVK